MNPLYGLFFVKRAAEDEEELLEEKARPAAEQPVEYPAEDAENAKRQADFIKAMREADQGLQSDAKAKSRSDANKQGQDIAREIMEQNRTPVEGFDDIQVDYPDVELSDVPAPTVVPKDVNARVAWRQRKLMAEEKKRAERDQAEAAERARIEKAREARRAVNEQAVNKKLAEQRARVAAQERAKRARNADAKRRNDEAMREYEANAANPAASVDMTAPRRSLTGGGTPDAESDGYIPEGRDVVRQHAPSVDEETLSFLRQLPEEQLIKYLANSNSGFDAEGFVRMEGDLFDDPAIVSALDKLDKRQLAKDVFIHKTKERLFRQLGYKPKVLQREAERYWNVKQVYVRRISDIKDRLSKLPPESSAAVELRMELKRAEVGFFNITANEREYENDILEYNYVYKSVFEQCRNSAPSASLEALQSQAKFVADGNMYNKARARRSAFLAPGKTGVSRVDDLELYLVRKYINSNAISVSPAKRQALRNKISIDQVTADLLESGYAPSDIKTLLSAIESADKSGKEVYNQMSQELDDAKVNERMQPILAKAKDAEAQLVKECNQAAVDLVNKYMAQGMPADQAKAKATEQCEQMYRQRMAGIRKTLAIEDMYTARLAGDVYDENSEEDRKLAMKEAQTIYRLFYDDEGNLKQDMFPLVSQYYGLTPYQSEEVDNHYMQQAAEWLKASGGHTAMPEITRQRLVAEYVMGKEYAAKLDDRAIAAWYEKSKAEAEHARRTARDKFMHADRVASKLQSFTKELTKGYNADRETVNEGTEGASLAKVKILPTDQLVHMGEEGWLYLAAKDDTGIFKDGITPEAKRQFIIRNIKAACMQAPVGSVNLDFSVKPDSQFNGITALYIRLYKAGLRPDANGKIDFSKVDTRKLKLTEEDKLVLPTLYGFVERENTIRRDNLVKIAARRYSVLDDKVKSTISEEDFIRQFLVTREMDYNPALQYVAFCRGANEAASRWKAGYIAPNMTHAVGRVNGDVLADFNSNLKLVNDKSGTENFAALGKLFQYNELDGKYDSNPWQIATGVDGSYYARRKPRVFNYTEADNDEIASPWLVMFGNTLAGLRKGTTFGLWGASEDGLLGNERWNGSRVAGTELYKLGPGGWKRVSGPGGTTRYLNEALANSGWKWTSIFLGAPSSDAAREARPVLARDGDLETIDNRAEFLGSILGAWATGKAIGQVGEIPAVSRAGAAVDAAKVNLATKYPKLFNFIRRGSKVANAAWWTDYGLQLANAAVQNHIAPMTDTQDSTYARLFNLVADISSLGNKTFNPYSWVYDPLYTAMFGGWGDAQRNAAIGSNITYKKKSRFEHLNPIEEYRATLNDAVNTGAELVSRAVPKLDASVKVLGGKDFWRYPNFFVATEEDIANNAKCRKEYEAFVAGLDKDSLKGDPADAYLTKLCNVSSPAQAIGDAPLYYTDSGAPVYVPPAQRMEALDKMVRGGVKLTPYHTKHLGLNDYRQLFSSFIKSHSNEHENIFWLVKDHNSLIDSTIGDEVSFSNFKLITSGLVCSLSEKGNEKELDSFLDTVDKDAKYITWPMRALIKDLQGISTDEKIGIVYKGFSTFTAADAQKVKAGIKGEPGGSMLPVDKTVNNCQEVVLDAVKHNPALIVPAMKFAGNLGIEWMTQHPMAGFGLLALFLLGIIGISSMLFGDDDDDEDEPRAAARRRARRGPDVYSNMDYENAYR